MTTTTTITEADEKDQTILQQIYLAQAVVELQRLKELVDKYSVEDGLVNLRESSGAIIQIQAATNDFVSNLTKYRAFRLHEM